MVMNQLDDKALAEFRGFAHIADVYVDALQDKTVLEQLEEIIAKIQTSLQSKKKVLILQ